MAEKTPTDGQRNVKNSLKKNVKNSQKTFKIAKKNTKTAENVENSQKNQTQPRKRQT